MIGTPFVASQIDEGNLPEDLLAFLEGDLQDGMGAGGLGVGGVVGGDALGAAVFEELGKLLP